MSFDIIQLAPLAIVLPFLGAALSLVLVRRNRAQRFVAIVSLSLTLLAECLVLATAWESAPTSINIAGWEAPFGIVLVVAVAIIWAVLGAAGVWDSINSIVQQSVGNASGPQFDVTDYVGTSRVLGFTMIVAVVDVILITAIATLGAFLYNLSAALLGGIEVTLAEDS